MERYFQVEWTENLFVKKGYNSCSMQCELVLQMVFSHGNTNSIAFPLLTGWWYCNCIHHTLSSCEIFL